MTPSTRTSITMTSKTCWPAPNLNLVFSATSVATLVRCNKQAFPELHEQIFSSNSNSWLRGFENVSSAPYCKVVVYGRPVCVNVSGLCSVSRFWRQGLDEIHFSGSRLVVRDHVPLFCAWLTQGRANVWSSRSPANGSAV